MPDCWNHTLQVRNEEDTYRCCSFKDNPLKEGPWTSVHKGKLLGNFEVTDAVVKIFRGQNSNTKNRQVRAEVKKHNLVKDVLLQCPEVRGLRLVRTFQSVVDKVGRGGRLKKMFTKDGRHHHVREGDSVLVQDFVKGQVQQLFVLTENQTSPRSGTSTLSLPHCLLQLVTMTYIHSGYSCVIGGVKGVVVSNPKDRRRVTYHLTSFTLHSLNCQFGDNDLGVLGVQMFQHWSGITPPVPPVLTPPPSSRFRTEDEEEDSFYSRARAANVLDWSAYSRPPQLVASRTRHPSPSAPPCTSSGRCSDGRISAFTDGRDPACGDHVDGGPRHAVRRGTLADVLAVCPQMRADFSESFLTNVLGPVPSYSFVCSETTL